MNYKIYPICLGRNEACEKSTFTYRRDCGVTMTAAYLVYLVSGEGRHILVDSGCPAPALAARMSYPKLSDARELRDELAVRGVSCGEIDAVILTHLHWDHCFNLELFPQAEVFVQEEELRHAVTPSAYDQYAYTATPGEGLPGWMTAFPQMTRLQGDAQLFPGVSVCLMPGHTPGLMCVAVDTAEGLYIITSDMIPLYENYEKGIPNGISISFADWYRSYDKLKQMGGRILPGHDMGVLDRTVYG